jgi:hypothetical protein
MRQIYRMFGRMFGAIIAAVVIDSALVGLAFAQGAPPAGQGAPADASAQQGADQGGAAGPAGASRPLEMPVLYVTGIEVLRSTREPKFDIVQVTGLASSQGWSSPQLVPFFYGKPADDVLDLQLIAASPLQSQKAEGFVPISAMFTLEPGSVFKGVRVRAGANAIELKQLPGVATTAIKANDCKDCIGKKFVEKGKAPAGASDVVHEEDLPRGFRTIAPTHGVAGIVHNPNRLNLILDDKNTIVMTFWE